MSTSAVCLRLSWSSRREYGRIVVSDRESLALIDTSPTCTAPACQDTSEMSRSIKESWDMALHALLCQLARGIAAMTELISIVTAKEFHI